MHKYIQITKYKVGKEKRYGIDLGNARYVMVSFDPINRKENGKYATFVHISFDTKGIKDLYKEMGKILNA